jgi:hypothetical protein
MITLAVKKLFSIHPSMIGHHRRCHYYRMLLLLLRTLMMMMMMCLLQSLPPKCVVADVMEQYAQYY